jgi:hypothetical protein
MGRANGILAVVLACASTFALSALAAEKRSTVTAVGNATDPDRSAAIDAAKEDAESNLSCSGDLQNTRTSLKGCVKVGSPDDVQWACAAISTATCVIDVDD